MNVKVYRKGDNMPKATAADVKAMREMIAARCRVQRPGLVDLFTPARGKSAFYRLPVVPPSVIDNPYRRRTEHGDDCLIVPVNSLGRAQTVTPSQAQSILLWIKQNLGAVVDPADVSIIVE